ncbi:MAG: SDR family NAD(P)-dependent oxidoreductase, partial [Butyricicoccus sp.]
MNKTVWITGGSRGIGAAAVREFAEHGWNVAFTYRASAEHAQTLCTEHGGQVRAFQANMTVRTAVEAAAAAMRAAFGP